MLDLVVCGACVCVLCGSGFMVCDFGFVWWDVYFKAWRGVHKFGEVCISLGLEHVLWPLCGCGHLCLLVVLCCDASLVDVVWIRAPCVLCLA